MSNLIFHDVTLRDGSHAANHQLKISDFVSYAETIDESGIDYIEVGTHGNGLGASSIQMGESLHDDISVLTAVRKVIKQSKLSVHVIAGYATIEKNLVSALESGVDLFRIASMCTEADTTQRHIEYIRNNNREVYGVLMMSHLADANVLLREAKKMQEYGAQAIVLMDSAGAYKFDDVRIKIDKLVSGLDIPVGFHGHENLGLSVGNSVIALESGATIIDASISGFGAGAGNTKLECLLQAINKEKFKFDIDYNIILDALELANERLLTYHRPSISEDSLLTSRYGLFSGFKRKVREVATEHNLSSRDVYAELGRLNAMGGQEDLIIEAAQALTK
jgi:4-hydroxy 2-oxovalerate aldolase